MSLDLTAIRNATKSLDEAIATVCDDNFKKSLNSVQKRLLVSGVIQNFEFTYKLSWKFIKRWLVENVGKNYVEGVT